MIYQIGGNTPSVVREYNESGWIFTTLMLRFLPKMFETCSSFVDLEQKKQVLAFSWKICGSWVEALAHERRRTSIMFAGRRSIGVNLYAPTWNTTLRFTAAPWTTSCLRRSECKGKACSGGQLWLWPRSPLTLRCFFHSILGPAARWCSDWLWSWSMAVARLLSQYWSIMPLPLPSLSGTEGVSSLSLSSYSSVYTVQPLPDPVNVWSVSSHTCSLNSDSWVKKLHQQRASSSSFDTLH